MLKKNLQFLQFINKIIPTDVIPIILSYEKNEYNKYYDQYSWEDIEDMLYELMEFDINFCEHIFKMFREIDITLLYTNAYNDPDITIKYMSFTKPVSSVSLNRFDWFYVDYFKVPGGGKRHFLEDEGTNYDDMIFMIITILKKFDKWYWNNYIGNSDHEILLKNIIHVYSTLVKYSYRNEYDFDDDNSIEPASPYC